MSNKPNGAEAESPAPQKSQARELGEALLIAFILAMLIRTFVIQAFKIPSGSMKDTLLIGDHLLVSKFSYGIHIPNEIPFVGIQLFPDYIFFQKVPERGDIIVFKYPRDPQKDFIKRVIGLPGDTLEIIRQRVYINGELMADPYAHHTVLPGLDPVQGRDYYGPTRVPEGHLFVMGDNRENSSDSRVWGFLDINMIRGKAQMIYWSWDSSDTSLRWRRLGNFIH